jgi:hypothetical protein
MIKIDVLICRADGSQTLQKRDVDDHYFDPPRLSPEAVQAAN